MSWETVIGLEIHVQLRTRSKLFSGAATTFGAAPNTQACAVDLGLPGVLPVLNREAVRMAIQFGLAIGANITRKSVFARKNYFYPDLPKGYQISQLDAPIVEGGHIDIEIGESTKRIAITRAHLEEDAGKSLHEDFQGLTGIDLNRAGTPLIEIVSEPEMSSATEALAYLRQIHALVQYLEICDGNMQEGSFRCDANVSVRKRGEPLGTRTELKNLNSFRFIERAINFEVERQIEALENGESIVQQTRLYDPDLNETRPMRSKEEAHDYRYFPDPDLLPVHVTDAQIDELASNLPELPQAKRARFVETYGLNADDCKQLTASRASADYFEAAVAISGDAKTTANWINGELAGALNRNNLEINAAPLTPDHLGMLVKRISDETISGKIAKQLFETIWVHPSDVDELIERQGLRQLTDTGALQQLVDMVVSANPDQVIQYLEGNMKVLGFLVGQVMKTSGGKANPKQVNQLLRERMQETQT